MKTTADKARSQAIGVRWILILPALVVCAPLAIATSQADDPQHRLQESMNTFMLFDFNTPEDPWRNVDDTVMGGVSSSRMRMKDGVAVFQGQLSMENNGGFASVRSDFLKQNLAGYEGLRLRAKGDGRSYQMRIRTDRAYSGPSHQMTFETQEDTWTEIQMPFSKFSAAWRGRPLPKHPPIDAAEIASMGILIADKQQGEFGLEIDWIQAYRSPEKMEASRELDATD